jgi:hypothetical protein
MRNALKIVFFVSIVLLVFILWPAREIEPEVRNLTTQINNRKPDRIILVYNATSDHWSVLKDFFHKLLFPKTYPCQLCNLTFGAFTMKKEWKNFLDSLPYEKQYLHKDEFVKKYHLNYQSFPVILASDKTSIWVLVTPKEINDCKSLEQLKMLTLEKLTVQ